MIIDLSQYNTVTDLRKAAAQCDGIILRLGIRGYSAGKLKLDKRFKEWAKELARLGKLRGVYFVTQAVSAAEAEEEALGCEKLRCASAAEFWQKRAELYRKTFEAVKAQRASWWEEARKQ